MKVQAAILHWDKNQAKAYAQYIQHDFRIETFLITGKDHETILCNQAIDQCKAEFLWFLTPDIKLPHPGVLDSILDVMTIKPEIGVVLPNRQNDIGVGGKEPYKKVLENGTAQLYRMSVGARFDKEFIFTGWNDLDFGNEVERRGYEVWVDPRTAVEHFTAYGSWSAFRNAYDARNRLLLEAKWYWPEAWAGSLTDGQHWPQVEMQERNWRGLETYNQTCAPNRRIPTIFELAWWSTEKLQAFVASVEMEHPYILVAHNGLSGNTDWTFE